MRNSPRGKSQGLRPRTTVFLSEIIEFNLDLAALIARKPKGEIIREAIAEYLKQKYGLDPQKKAEITLKYKNSSTTQTT